MQLLATNDLEQARLTPEQRVFVDTLYQMVHLESLDSYRAKCLNLRTIMGELRHELGTGRLGDDDVRIMAKECVEFLNADALSQSAYGYQASVLLPLLMDLPTKPKKVEKAEDHQKVRSHERFLHCVADFSVELEKTYFAKLCEALPKAIAEKDTVKIIAITDAIVSDLVYQGYSFSSLYGWHKKFLANPGEYTFEENLDFMLRWIQQPRSRFKVTLRLSGSDKPSSIGTKGHFSFEKTPTPPDDNDEKAVRFFQSRPLRTFASCEIESTDHEAAAIQARGEAESFLDLMRLEYERNPVTIDPEVHAIRLEDGKAYVVKVKTLLPNPVEEMTHKSFIVFAGKVEGVLSNHRVESNTREQVRAAIRQFRIGRDSLRAQDKCLHWWMGLEALAHTGSNNIGEGVVHNVSRVLVCGYLFRLIRDLMVTLKHCKINWTDDLKNATQCQDLNGLSVANLLTLLQDATTRLMLWNVCHAHPVIQCHGERLGQALEDPKTTVIFIKNHLSRLEWQVSRLYRIRCCIVHGSDTKHTLYPFAANLEYYLKQVILFVLDVFSTHEHITSRQELFHRASLSFDRKIEILTNAKDKQAVRRAVFEDIVLRPSLP